MSRKNALIPGRIFDVEKTAANYVNWLTGQGSVFIEQNNHIDF
jgi:hypothetical protein